MRNQDQNSGLPTWLSRRAFWLACVFVTGFFLAVAVVAGKDQYAFGRNVALLLAALTPIVFVVLEGGAAWIRRL